MERTHPLFILFSYVQLKEKIRYTEKFKSSVFFICNIEAFKKHKASKTSPEDRVVVEKAGVE